MSVFVLAPRVSSVEYSVDEFGRRADSFNAVLSGTATINGPCLLNGPSGDGQQSYRYRYQRCGWIADRPRSKGSVREPEIPRPVLHKI